MKTTSQKLVAFLLTAFMAMSVMAVSLNNTAHAEMIEKPSGTTCPAPKEGEPKDKWIDFSPQGFNYCVSKDDPALKPCAPGSASSYTVEGEGLEDLCKVDTGAAAKAAESQMAKDTWKKFTTLIIGVESMMNKALWPILVLTGDLMNNNILFGPGMEQKLYDIWVPVRNIVNIFFVIALIGLALYSVLGINSENGQYSIKAMLPKLIAGIIAVNFSFIAIKVVLDAVNVFSTSIFAIPTQVQGLDKAVMDNGEGSEMSKGRKAFCEAVYLDGKQWGGGEQEFKDGVKSAALFRIRDEFGFGGISDVTKIEALSTTMLSGDRKTAFDAELEKLTKEVAWCVAEGNKLKLTPAGLGFFQKYGSQNAALAMAINMGEIMFYNRVSTSLIGSGTYESMAIKTLFILLMYIIYGASFVALFIILLARLIVVWLGLAMSPVIALSMVVPMVKDKLGLGELTSQFMKHAIAPIMVAFPMTVGWIMLNALHSTSSEASAYGAKDMLIPGIPIPGLETLQGLLISLATAAVVWVGVFAAAKGTIAEKATGFLKDQLEKLGTFVATAPLKYTPWVPVQMQEGGKTESYSPMALLNAANKFQNDMEYKSGQKFIADNPGLFPGGGSGGPAGLNSATQLDGLMKVIQQDGEKMKKDPKEYNERIQQLKGSKGYLDLKYAAENRGVTGLTETEAKAILKAIDEGDFSKLPRDVQKIAENYLKANPQGSTPVSAAADAAKLEQEAAETIAKDDLGYKDDGLKKEPGKVTVGALKVADRIREAGMEEKPEEIAKIATEMKKITKADGKTKLSNTEIMGIVKKKTTGIGTADKRNKMMQAALDEIDKAEKPAQSTPTPAPAEETPTPPAEGNPPTPAA